MHKQEQDNLRIIKQLEKDIQEGNLEAFLDKLVENVVWIVPGPSLYPFAGRYCGHEQIKKLFAMAAEVQTEQIDPKDFIAQDNKVVVQASSTVCFKASRRTVELESVHLFTLRDGKVVEFRGYLNI